MTNLDIVKGLIRNSSLQKELKEELKMRLEQFDSVYEKLEQLEKLCTKEHELTLLWNERYVNLRSAMGLGEMQTLRNEEYKLKIEELTEKIDELKMSSVEWKKLSDQCPEVNGWYLVKLDDGVSEFTDFAEWTDGDFDTGVRSLKVTQWSRLPL